jgi:HEAT repeat protein
MRREVTWALVSILVIGGGVCLGRTTRQLALQAADQQSREMPLLAHSSQTVERVIETRASVIVAGRNSPAMTDTMSDDDLIAVAGDIHVDAKERNDAMERLRSQLPALQAMEALDRLSRDTTDIDVYRSWGVQHLGMLVKGTSDLQARQDGLRRLRDLARHYPEGTLVRREALFALVEIGLTEDVTWITRLTREGLAIPSPDCDLWARFAGMLRLHDQVPSLRTYATSNEWSLRMSAIEALKLLGDSADAL